MVGTAAIAWAGFYTYAPTAISFTPAPETRIGGRTSSAAAEDSGPTIP